MARPIASAINIIDASGRMPRVIPASGPLPAARMWIDYALAAGATGLAFLLQLLVWRYIQPLPFLLFFGAVMYSGARGGWGPGILSTVLSALIADYFFLGE